MVFQRRGMGFSGGSMAGLYSRSLPIGCLNGGCRSGSIPMGTRPPLSYHGDLGRWKCDWDYAYLQGVGLGQGFVLDLEQYPEAVDWVSGLVSNLTR